MLATTVSQREADPTAWPGAPGGMSDAAVGLDWDMIWQRLEGWVAYRWTPRDVTWIVEGPGHWTAPLAPATVSAGYRWTGEAWATFTLPAGPFGHDLPAGIFKIEASVGGGDVPDAVNEAYRRLAEYMAETPDEHGASSYSVQVGNSFSKSYDRNPAWLAKALHYSGAADLLRPYRRA